MAAAPVDNSPKNRVYANNEIIPHIARKALVETDAAQICLDGISNEQTRQAALAALQEMHIAKAVDGLIHNPQEPTNPPTTSAAAAGAHAAPTRGSASVSRWRAKPTYRSMASRP